MQPPTTATAPAGVPPANEQYHQPTPSRRQRPESPRPTLRSRPFTCKRFHVLSNSLFKVLFNFPSRYLFAIGLAAVFSLRWSLPPTLGCILKQPDSRERPRHAARCCRGLTPALGQAPIRRTQTPRHAPKTLPNTTCPKYHAAKGFGAGLIPFHSPLLRESLLVSFPPLNDMLKFSG